MKTCWGFIVQIFLTVSVFAQDYYSGKETISTDSITFKIEINKYVFSLSNVNNELDAGGRLYYKDGRLLEDDYIEVLTAMTVPGCVEQAFAATFTKEEFQRLQESDKYDITISYVFNSEGITTEVGFIMPANSEMLSIPPSKFALLDKNLKKYVKWDVTDLGKQLKYMFGVGFARFSKMNLRYPDDPIPEVGAGQIDPEIKDPNLPGMHE